jgi:hypothetical protein
MSYGSVGCRHRDLLQQSQLEAPTAPPLEERRLSEEKRLPLWGASGVKLAQALVFGLAFGSLLQKGGVANFDILIGVLLLENFVVVKVMLSAIIVGMIGVYLLNRLGLLELQVKETTYGSNIVGGLIFGVGFALLAYCPGTGAAALGQGNLDAIVGILGMILGSYLFAVWSTISSGTVRNKGKRGKVRLPEFVGLSTGAFIAIALPLLTAVLAALELFAGS